MLVAANKLIGTPILSMQAGGAIGRIIDFIVDPDTLKIIAFRLEGPVINRNSNILDVSSVREYSNFGMVIDDTDELVAPDDVVKISKILELNFSLISLKVETKKGSKLGKIINFTVTSEDFTVQQLIVKRPAIKSFIDPELTIHRKEIVEITDYKVIVKDEEKILKEKAAKEDFVPNFVNPFREQQPDFAPADTETPAGKDN
ncbi:MAG: hypothetical protein Q4C24_01800 [Candidatus Saccharibacteria bacterium]|uniref:PRC-barrel domain-containing protein n=1 Tax=Candidatus Nanosyncoccus alces TaxID=2171997 RepID=A0ABY0FLX8_9BACT|nr:hypothetical protein [Candidatus Nanosyncoccus alces]MBQ2643361.1 hypothetical protein [Candidatus Saccharibacteria bacterium]MDO4399005.1 hypothetical protein [Candidatus Saccharibacteria bacterium]RYC74849.1 hypothetical protein G3RUM_00398 [Candidatus Nanosyncoccus alces]